MLTNFYLYEKYGESIYVDINLPDDILNKLIDSMSFIVYKGTKRNEQRHKNYKSLRVKNLSGYYNQNILQKNEVIDECFLKIEMTNGDVVIAKYKNKKLVNGDIVENSIYVKINDEPLYYLDDEKYDINYLILVISNLYKKYIKLKSWKIK